MNQNIVYPVVTSHVHVNTDFLHDKERMTETNRENPFELALVDRLCFGFFSTSCRQIQSYFDILWYIVY